MTPWSAGDIAREAGVARSTVYRLLDRESTRGRGPRIRLVTRSRAIYYDREDAELLAEALRGRKRTP